MNHQSSYQAPRSERTSSSGSSYTTRGHRNKKKNPYNRTSWKDNPILRSLVFYILPFFVINGLIFFFAVYTPSIELTVGDTTDYQSVEVSFRVKSLLPVKHTTVTLDSQPLEVTKEGKEYHATLTSNGVIQISTESINGMSRTVFEQVNLLDDTPPTIEEDYTLDSNFLTITVSDALSGVDYDNIYGLDEDHQQVEPFSVDQSTGTVVFPMNGNTIVVHIQDFAGNVAEPSYSIRVEGLDEGSESESDDEDESSSRDSEDEDDSSSTRETARSTTAARETTRSTTAARETTRSTTAARETTRSTTAARETTRSTTAARETTAPSSTAAAGETTEAATVPSTTAPVPTAPTAAPTTTASPGPGGASGPGVSTTAASQPTEPAAPGGNGTADTIIPLD